MLSGREQTTKRRSAQTSASGTIVKPAALACDAVASRGSTARPRPAATMRHAASRLETWMRCAGDWPASAAWQAGITRFDTCLAGIGGCPHAPGASSDVATEDLADLFASMGVATGQDFDPLIALRAKLASWLEGETLHGSLWRAGLPKTMMPILQP